MIVKIIDENDNGPQFDFSSYSFKLNETSLNGSVVGKVHATDADSGDNGRIEYYMAGSAASEEPFGISKSNGAGNNQLKTFPRNKSNINVMKFLNFSLC